MTDELSPQRVESNASGGDVFVAAFFCFYFIVVGVGLVVIAPLAALQLLNDYILHRGEGWVDQFAPPGNWLIVLIAGVAAALYLGAIPWFPKDMLLPSRRQTYVLSVLGIMLAIATQIAIAGVVTWLEIEDLVTYDRWYQGWG